MEHVVREKLQNKFRVKKWNQIESQNRGLSSTSRLQNLSHRIMLKHFRTIYQDRPSEDRRRQIRPRSASKKAVWVLHLRYLDDTKGSPQRKGWESKTSRAHWMLATNIIHHSNLHWSLEHRSGAQSSKIHQNLKTTRIAETR